MKMNDEYQLNDEQLRLATSRTLPAGAPLDTQTATARENFLRLGAALESAAGHLDESAIISHPSREQTCATTNSREQTCSRSRAADHLWPFLLAGALAASAVFAILRITSMLPKQNDQVALVTQDRHANAAQPEYPAGSTATWNDPLDDEIALAAATIEQYRSRSPTFDNSLFDMNIQLEALSQELLRESL